MPSAYWAPTEERKTTCFTSVPPIAWTMASIIFFAFPRTLVVLGGYGGRRKYAASVPRSAFSRSCGLERSVWPT